MLWLCFLEAEKYCVSSSLLLSVSTRIVVVRFETVKVCLWLIKVTPKPLVILCFDVNNRHGGTTNILLGYGYGKFGWMCLYTRPKPLPMVRVWNIAKNLKMWAKLLYSKNMNKYINIYIFDIYQIFALTPTYLGYKIY